METIKKIKAEIERRYNDNLNVVEKFELGKITATIFGEIAKEYLSLMSFIESLEKEPDAPKIKGWVARDRNKALFFHHEKPHRYYGDTWRTDWVMHPQPELHHLRLLDGIMPNLKWEDEPIEVELIIKRV